MKPYTQKATHSVHNLYEMSKADKSLKAESRVAVARGKEGTGSNC